MVWLNIFIETKKPQFSQGLFFVIAEGFELHPLTLKFISFFLASVL